MPAKRRNLQSTSDKRQDNGVPRRMKPQQWLLVGAGVLGVGAAVARWAVNNRRVQARRHLNVTDERELAMIPLPSRPAQVTDAAQTAPLFQPPAVAMPQSAPASAISDSALPAAAMTPPPASAPDTYMPSNTTAASLPDAAEAGPSLSGTVATKKRSASKAVLPESAQSAEADPSLRAIKAVRGASKTGAASSTSAALEPTAAPQPANAPETTSASGKKKMSNTTGKRSKMSEEFDQALEENTVEGPGNVGGIAQTAVAGMSAVASSAPAPGVTSNAPAENALATQAEGKLAVGEELRDREFSVPPQDSGAVSQRLLVDQDTLAAKGNHPGGAIGTMPGDHQPEGDINDIVDQRSVTPDLPQQQG